MKGGNFAPTRAVATGPQLLHEIHVGNIEAPRGKGALSEEHTEK